MRQSLDKSGEGAAVDRQLSECTSFCEVKGWEVGDVFTDNDISATSGKRRPGFEALLESNPPRIVVWHIDRLVRLSRELERVIDLGVNVCAVKSGHIDLSNPAGRATAKTITAWAQYEGEQKATRQTSANRQRAQKGSVVWSRRPFGFTREGRDVAIEETEAAEIRRAAGALLGGATLTKVAAELNARDVRTSLGGKWTIRTLKQVVLNPRVTGRVVYRGEDMGTQGPAILDADTYDRLNALLRDPRRKNAPSTAVKYLLSGIAVCGREMCHLDPLMATTNGASRVHVYRCRKCYLARHRERVDEVVMATIAERLSRPDAAALLSPALDLSDLRAEVGELRTRRDGLASLLADGLLSAESVRVQAKKLGAQIGDLERTIDAATGASPLAAVVGAEDVAARLVDLSLLALREVVRTLCDVVILPAGKGVRFSPDQVRIEWKG